MVRRIQPLSRRKTLTISNFARKEVIPEFYFEIASPENFSDEIRSNSAYGSPNFFIDEKLFKSAHATIPLSKSVEQKNSGPIPKLFNHSEVKKAGENLINISKTPESTCNNSDNLIFSYNPTLYNLDESIQEDYEYLDRSALIKQRSLSNIYYPDES